MEASALLGLPLEIVPAGQELSELADELKVAKKMSLANCFAALAKRETAEIYAGDPEFKTVEREIKVFGYRVASSSSEEIRNTQHDPDDSTWSGRGSTTALFGGQILIVSPLHRT
jgi:hypothetical protein